MNDWQGRLTVALRSFWRIRERQAAKSKGRDRGSRDREGGLRGRYQEPSEELTFSRFAASLIGRAATYAALRGSSAHA